MKLDPTGMLLGDPGYLPSDYGCSYKRLASPLRIAAQLIVGFKVRLRSCHKKT